MILKELKLNTWIGDATNCYIIQDEKSKETMVIDPAGDVDKIIETANNQVKDIELIESIGGMDLLDDKTKVAAIYRMKYKEASLLELSEIISLETKTPITKSGLHHRFTKIKDLANKIRNNE